MSEIKTFYNLDERKIIVVGHKNPDTDSICSAIAYADFKNRSTGTGRYMPGRAGEINAETKYVLHRLSVQVPKFINDASTQIRDMEIKMTPGISKDTTINRAWQHMKDNDAVTQPVTENDKVIGIVTKGDIARAFMDSHDSYFLSGAAPKFSDIADTISGEIVVGDGEKRFTSGKVLVGAAGTGRMKSVVEENDIVILVDRYENQMTALEEGASCLIVTLGAETFKTIRDKAEETGAVIIETDLDTFSVAREINKSIPVEAIMITENIRCFKLTDYVDNVKTVMASTRHRAFPVITKHGNYIGTVSRRNLIAIKRKELILVDHNEKSQAVDNIDEADILEVVDHHRLGTLETLEPIVFINQPVGCTATILYEMYNDKGIKIMPTVAGLLLAAIISDTLMFRSPTCTARDIAAAKELADISGIDIEEFATSMFKAGSDLSDKSPEEVFFQDFKKFTTGDIGFGVGQISSMDEEELAEIREKLRPIMESECGRHGISMIFFLLTDIRQSRSEIVCTGEGAEELILTTFGNAVKSDGGYIVDGLLSRKKQLIPEFIRVLSQE
jgi:manganese-dependent inorganic pyrophosphatase